MKIGIIGGGAVGGALATLATGVGHDVLIGSRQPEASAGRADANRWSVGTPAQAAAHGEIVVVAVPLSALHDLPAEALAGRLVIDAMNYYPERDGAIAELDERRTTTSEMVARHLAASRVVKAFNAIFARDLPTDARPPIASGHRQALPIAGDDPGDKALAAGLHEQFGFDVVDAGPLADSWRFERAKPAYCVPLDAAALRDALAAAKRDVELPQGS